MLLGGLAAQRGDASAGRLMVLALASVISGVVAVARISGWVFDYLVRGWWVIGAVVWLSILYSTWSLFARATTAVRAGAVGVAIATTVGASFVLSWRAVPLVVPAERESVAVADLAGQLAEVLADDGRYLVQWADVRGLGGVGMGVFVDLRRDGHSVFVPPEYETWFDDWHLADPSSVDATVSVIGSDDLAGGLQLPDGSAEVATYDPLTASERARADDLWAEIVAATGSTTVRPGDVDSPDGRRALARSGVDATALDELQRLRRRGSAYSVYLHPST